MSKSIFIGLTICLFAFNFLYANYNIHGIIQSQNTNQPMAYVTAALYKTADSTLVTGVISNEEGEFNIEFSEEGNYYIEISAIGFQKHYINSLELTKENAELDLGIILLNEQNISLDEVTLTGERSAVEYKVDRKVINLDKLGIAASAPLSEALQILPSIESDIQGNVKMRGSENFQVLIDGKPTILSGSEALQQFTASQIEKIEIITNPSAKYDADNTSGIINLILKKGEGMGFSGTLNYGGTKGGNKKIGRDEPYNGGATLTYRQEKYALTGAFNIHKRTFFFEWTDFIERVNLPNYVRLSSNAVPWNVSRFSLDFDYFINDRHTITLAGRIMQRDNGFNLLSEYRLDTPNSNPIFTQNIGDSDRHTRAITLHDRLNFNGENHELKILFTYYNQSIDEPQSIYEFPISHDELPNSSNILNTRSEHNQFQFKLDYSKPFSEDEVLEMGFNLQTIARDSYREVEVFLPTAIPLKIDQFDIKNDTYAAYTTYKNKIAGIGLQAGLRIEQYNRLINQLNSENSYNYKKLNLFPSLHLIKNFNDSQELKLSYTRRINRPSMGQLQPYINNATRFNSYGGNPNLIPAYINSSELSYTHRFNKLTITTEGYYRNTTNAIVGGENLNTETNILEATPVNIDSSEFYGIESSFNISATNWLKIIASGTYFKNTISGEFFNLPIFQQYNAWRVRLNNSISLTKDIKLNINGYYNSKKLELQEEIGNQYWMDISLSTPILKKQGILSFSFSDVLDTYAQNTFVKGNNYTLSQNFKYPGQIFGINLSYKFNSYKNKENSFGFED